MLLSGLRSNPKEHMPWLKAIGEEQQEVKRASQRARRRIELLALRAERDAMRRQARRMQGGCDGG
jgi:hypothetical protein